jgi:hypothetical protein
MNGTREIDDPVERQQYIASRLIQLSTFCRWRMTQERAERMLLA